ncbi:MAG: RNA polymerase factor sigma-54 [Bacteroidales bacterium]|jgi:RNA polymerase sigma-54 factor|nr:RNA polymerase factor sigma-54 [Bacteroidales bacterium]MBS3774740.1 RNA polymerase factor sigma-54 [Bacteroidales bacterium]
MLKQSLEQKLLQKLSPQQIQMIKMLEIPTLQLEQRIKQELEDNPVLEEGEKHDEQEGNYEEQQEQMNEGDQDEFSFEDYINNDDDIPSYKLQSSNVSKDDKKEEVPFSQTTSFHENLENQIGLKNLTEREHLLAQYILGNIDEDGYLRRKVESIVNDLAFTQNLKVSEEEVERVLKIVQELDPPGVGARNLRECLLIQIKQKDQERPSVKLAKKILEQYFNEFTKKHYDKIITRLKISEEQLEEAFNEILKLNPKPGSVYTSTDTRSIQTIVPDFILENNDGKLELSLNSKNVPDLHINKDYSAMLEEYQKNKQNKTRDEKEAVSFVKQKLEAAKWFIDAIRQRQNTLLITMNAILDYQYEFFQTGDESQLRPMILKDIADKTGLDISTISRVVNSKYIQTPFGIYPLKYFFSEGLQKEDGEEVSTRRIKSILKENIDNEDKRKPLTDEKLAEILREQGYRIARRTVAKYREQMNIPVARLRKELKG